jgi:hypothetical protein
MKVGLDGLEGLEGFRRLKIPPSAKIPAPGGKKGVYRLEIFKFI